MARPMRRTRMKRTPMKKRQKPMKRTPIKRNGAPKRKPKKAMNADERAKLLIETRAFKEAARRQQVCALCGKEATNSNPWEAHHVITQSFLKREHLDQWHPDNSLRLCQAPCHDQHTRAFIRLPLRCLTDRNIAYAVALLGEEKAHTYLTRHYTGKDPRVDRLTEGLEYEDD